MENDNNFINEPVTEETTDSQPINDSVSETPADTNNVQKDSQSISQPRLLFILSLLFMYGIDFILDIVVITYSNIHDTKDILFHLVVMKLGLYYHYSFLLCLFVVGFILMIKLLVKYPKYIYGKILLLITIAYMIVFGIEVCYIGQAIDSCCQSCLPIH